MPTETDGAGVFVVIASYNEARVIRDVVDRLSAHWSRVVVVDDGSSDVTAERLAGCGATLLRHVVNRGQGAALQTGIAYSLARGARCIVTFDADGQHDPADIAALARPVLAGECDVALGSRFLGRPSNVPLARKLLLKAGILFTRFVSRIALTDVHNGLRAFSRPAAQSLRITMDRMAHASEILDQVRTRGWRYREVPVTIRYTEYSRAKGQSSWNALRIALKLLVEKLSR